MSLEEQALKAFYELANKHNWRAYHNARSLSTAIAVEAGELLQLVCWLDDRQSTQPSQELTAAMSDEIADIYMYLLALCDHLDIRLADTVKRKIAHNKSRHA